MNAIIPADDMVLIEGTNVTQGGRPVVRVNGVLYTVEEVPHDEVR